MISRTALPSTFWHICGLRLPFLACIHLSLSLSPSTDVILLSCLLSYLPSLVHDESCLLFPAPLLVSHTFHTPFYDRSDGWKIIVAPSLLLALSLDCFAYLYIEEYTRTGSCSRLA